MRAFDDLVGETNAHKWAKEFVKVAELRPDIPRDEGTMIGWFANAIMAGYDDGRRIERRRGFEEWIRELAYQCAGVGSGAVMEDAPDVVMPSEKISKRVDELLLEFGVQPERRQYADIFGDAKKNPGFE